MISVCSLQGVVVWNTDGKICPDCGNPCLRPATEWEQFMGHPLSLEEEMDVRGRVQSILRGAL